MAEAITVHCPACQTAFPVDPDKVPSGGVHARCSECSEVFRVEDPGAASIREPDEVGTGAEEAVEEAGAVIAEAEAPPEEPEAPSEEPELAVAEEEPPAEEMSEVQEHPVSEAPSEAVEEEAPADDEMDLDTVDYFFGGDSEEEVVSDAEPGGDAGVGLEEPPSEAEEDGYDEPDFDLGEPEVDEEEAPAAQAGPDTVEAGAGEAPPADADEGVAAPSAGEVVEAETAATPRPAFGQRSPEEKAQRLARVLVSDMITYNPQMYEKAMAEGTLAEDFEDEIEKSWEEYVDQVGEDLATSTSYWKDALNEILAKGEEIF